MCSTTRRPRFFYLSQLFEFYSFVPHKMLTSGRAYWRELREKDVCAAPCKGEGRKSRSESRPEVVALAKRLSRNPTNRRKRSLRDIAAEPSTEALNRDPPGPPTHSCQT